MAKLSIMGAAQPETPFASTPAGIASNTLKGLLGWVPLNENPYLKVAADIGQGIARTVGSVGLTAINKTLSLVQPKSEQPTIQIPEYLHPLFGSDTSTLSDLPTRAADLSAKIQANPFAQRLGLDKISMPLGYGAVLGTSALDLTGFGGEEKNAVKALVKETDPVLVSGILQKMGIDASTASKFAPEIAASKSVAEVNHLLDLTKGVHGLGTIAEAEKAAQASPDVLDAYMAARAKPAAEAALSTADQTKIADEVVHQLTATNDPFEAVDIVKKNFPNLTDELARKTATKIAAESDVSKVEQILKNTGKLDARMAAGEIKAAAAAPEKPIAPEIPAAAREATIPKAAPGEAEYGKIFEDAARYHELSLEHSFNKDTLSNDPASQLYERFYRGTRKDPTDPTQSLEDIMQRAQKKQRAASRKGGIANLTKTEQRALRLDTEIEALGYQDFGQAQDAVEAYAKRLQQHNETAAELKRLKPRARAADILNSSADQNIPKRAVRPAEKFAEITKGPDGPSWSSLLKNYNRSLGKTDKVHVLDYLATPEFVLEKIGLGRAAELLQDAKLSYRNTLKKEIDRIAAWKKEVGNDPYASMRIFRYLDGHEKDVFKEMSATEVKVAKEMREYLKEWADRLHLPEDNRIARYITHIFDPGDQAIAEGASIFDDPELAAIMQEKPAGSVYDPFLQKRLGKRGYKEDVWAALDAYVKRASRKEAMDPALEAMKVAAKRLDDTAYRYVASLSHRINMRPTDLDKLVDNFVKETPMLNRMVKNPRPTAAITKKIRNLFYRGTLGLNFSSALRNLSQGANTYAKLGEKYTVIGYTRLFARLLTNNLKDLHAAGIFDEELLQDKKIGIYKSMLQKLDPVLFSMFSLAERINRGAAFYGAESKALAKGLSPEQATKYAARVVRETQFAFGNVDSPVVLSSDIAKTALQLGTYNVKQIEFLSRMAKNGEFAGLLRWSLASLAFVATIGKLFGMTVGQLIPSVGLGGSPVGNLLTGFGELMSSDQQTRAKGQSDLKRAAVSIFPAGAQIRKTVQGIQAYDRGRDITPTGRTRFVIPQTTGSFLQSALFGKSALPQARDYYDKLNSSKKKAKSTLKI